MLLLSDLKSAARDHAFCLLDSCWHTTSKRSGINSVTTVRSMSSQKVGDQRGGAL